MKYNWVKSMIAVVAVFIVLGCGGSSNGPTLQPPVIAPAGGEYTKIFRITLSSANASDEIRYTLNNTAPTLSSTKYVFPIPVTVDGSNVTIRAITVHGGSQASAESTASWTLKYAYVPTSKSVDPGASLTEGVMVRDLNSPIDWARVKEAGIVFAFIRAADGTEYVDSKFADNWPAAKAAGVLRAPYQFFEPDQDPVLQADKFCKQFTLTSGDLPPMLDVELKSSTLKAEEYAGKIAQWVAYVEENTGMVPIIYTAAIFWNGDDSPGGNPCLGGCTAFRDLPLTVGHYATASPSTPDAWTAWTFWNYTMTGVVTGITGNVNLVHYNGTETQLQTLQK
ncbi:MAG: GH25 family lysozyme [Deltaproteobacteria bacterium]|nr:GH25 family lysozyme [Deltaproteobacteria bacterium]